MKVLWTEPALNQLESIHQYISQTSIDYANRMVDRLTRRSQQIGEFPLSGRVVPDFKSDRIREIIERPYRIVYQVLPDRIEVLAVLHGAQSLSE